MSQRLRASFRNNIKGWKQDYPKKRALLLISVGQHYHESEKFEATAELIARTGFSQCSIAVCDTIQRYNYQFDASISESTARNLAYEDGRAWIARNHQSIKLIKQHTKTELLFWDTFLNGVGFLRNKYLIENTLNSNRTFRNAFLYSAEKYIERNKVKYRINNVDKHRVLGLSMQYLIEECAIIMLSWSEESFFDYLIYPSNMLKAMEETQKLVSEEKHFHWLSLRFKRTFSEPFNTNAHSLAYTR